VTKQRNNSFARELLAWWDTHGRHDLPWQHNPTPYRVWVSEIMLQQTQVATVEKYFDRFMGAFPDVMALAEAPQDDVLHYWSGLGYYSRARNLHAAARQIVADQQGIFPQTLEELMALPGIGRSTAGAILSLAMQQREPILDGNVKRVLARVFAVEGWSGSTANLKTLWAHSETLTPDERVANYTQAIMDLGATLCTRGRPNCFACPLAQRCVAFERNLTGEIPAPKPKPKRARPRREAVFVMAVNAAGEVLLEKRPASGIWGGLWSFPELESADEVAVWCQRQLAAKPAEQRAWPTVEHSFSHFDLDMQPVEVRVDRCAEQSVMDGDRWLWYNTRSPAGIGLAAPVARLLQSMAARSAGPGNEPGEIA
jgi:A/G-specific adenine glycosylase